MMPQDSICRKLVFVSGNQDIREDVCARMEITNQMEQEVNSLFGHIPARRRLKSRKSFMAKV